MKLSQRNTWTFKVVKSAELWFAFEDFKLLCASYFAANADLWPSQQDICQKGTESYLLCKPWQVSPTRLHHHKLGVHHELGILPYNLHKLGVLPTTFHLITGTKHTDLSSSPLTLSSCICYMYYTSHQTENLLNYIAWNRYICTTTDCCMGRYSQSLY